MWHGSIVIQNVLHCFMIFGPNLSLTVVSKQKPDTLYMIIKIHFFWTVYISFTSAQLSIKFSPIKKLTGWTGFLEYS